MQRETGNEVHIGPVSPFDSIGKSAINRTASEYDNSREKIKKMRQLISMETYNADIARYIFGTLDLVLQGMIEDIDTKEKTAHISYKDMKQLDFHKMLKGNYYVYPNSIHLCFPMKIKKQSNEASDTDTDLITVNDFFAHLIKEISIIRYRNNKQLIPIFSSYKIYQYSDSMLKHLPKLSIPSAPDAKTIFTKTPFIQYEQILLDKNFR